MTIKERSQPREAQKPYQSSASLDQLFGEKENSLQWKMIKTGSSCFSVTAVITPKCCCDSGIDSARYSSSNHLCASCELDLITKQTEVLFLTILLAQGVQRTCSAILRFLITVFLCSHFLHIKTHTRKMDGGLFRNMLIKHHHRNPTEIFCCQLSWDLCTKKQEHGAENWKQSAI